MFCPKCGNRNPENVLFCSRCGCSTELSSQPDYAPSTQSPWEPPADDFFPDLSDPAWAAPVQDPPGTPAAVPLTSSMPGPAPEDALNATLTTDPSSAPVLPSLTFPDTQAVPSVQEPVEVPPSTESSPPAVPRKALLLSILLPLTLLIGLLLGVFAADYLSDRSINLFGALDQTKSNEDPAPSATTAPTEAASAPTADDPIPTDTQTDPAETLPAETLPSVVEPVMISLPVQGQIVTGYTVDRLIYNPTTQDHRIHDGLDIAAEAGTPVRAVADGTVSRVYQDDTMGNTVVIEHPDGYTATYSSLAEDIPVRSGDAVRKGQTVGFVGLSALVETAVGAHVHFSIRLDGQSVDPKDFLSTCELSQNEAALLQVIEGDNGNFSVRSSSSDIYFNYLSSLAEYAKNLKWSGYSEDIPEIDWWEYVDFDQDGQPEVYVVLDSPIYPYLVLHWTGFQVCGFAFDAREMCDLKTNGWFSASSGASYVSFHRLSFLGVKCEAHTVASFDYGTRLFEIDGKAVSQAEADQFLSQWSELPKVTRPDAASGETDPKARCEDCGVWYPKSQLTDGLCSGCQSAESQALCPCCGDALGSGELDNDYGMCDSCLRDGGKCSVCGKLTGYLDSGVCSSCQKPINTAACAYCGTETDIDLLYNGLCEECYYWRGVGWCAECGKLSDSLFEGVCEECEPWGGRGEPEECCAHCGQPSYDLMNGLCNDCYWYVGWCSICGQLSYDLFDGVCSDCAPREDSGDSSEEYTSQCTVCGEWSDTVFEGVCDSCGGYDGRG